MIKRVRKRIKEHVQLFNYNLTEEQEEDIVTLYLLNHESYDEQALTLFIENFVQNASATHDNTWMQGRRPSVFATKVDVETLELSKFPKSKETFNFLISRLGTELPFCLLSEEQKTLLVESMYPMVIEKNVKLLVEGEFGTEMYIIEDGEFEVLIKGKHLNTLHSGSVFGELALLHGIPRTATVIASEKSKVWTAEQTSFSCIRIRDQIYRKSLTREALQNSKYFVNMIRTRENLEKLVESSKNVFITADTVVELKKEEIAVVLKKAEIVDTETRAVKPKDLIAEPFYAKTELECVVLNFDNLQINK